MPLNHSIKLNATWKCQESAHLTLKGRHDPQGGFRVAQLLLDRGMDVNRERDDLCTLLHVASWWVSTTGEPYGALYLPLSGWTQMCQRLGNGQCQLRDSLVCAAM